MTIPLISVFILSGLCLLLVLVVFVLATMLWRTKAEPSHEFPKHYLTNLPNRVVMLNTLEGLLSGIKDNSINVALLYVDIDDFDNINKSLGSAIGDALLVHLSKAIATLAYKYTKYVYHVDSDEFVIILYDYGDNINVVNDIVREIINIVAQPSNINEYDLVSSCGVGVCVYPECSHDANTLLKNASEAKSVAKKNGFGSQALYTIEMSKKSAMRTLISGDLRLALERKEFYLKYQPIVNPTTGKVHVVEALLRWRHPSLGNITTDTFIPVIEDLGLIHSVGKWVIHTACREIYDLQVAGYPGLRVAINISAHQFNKGDIASIVAEAIWESGISADSVDLELTEAAVMSDPVKATLMLNVLQTMGVRIAVDDFGIGYSSINQLTNLPINILKIDQSFIHNLHLNPVNAALVSTMIRMGKQLGYTVVAEGVETQEELDMLRKEDCDLIQGYYYSKALSIYDLKKYLQDSASHLSSRV